MRDRRVARATIAAGIVLFACVSIPRLRLDYAPDVSFPELAVVLRLPPSVNIDSTETTRRWVIPIESALRAAGDTTGTRGEVEPGAATIVARFKRGTDVELKAARLASDLARLRARLPERSALSVFPARGGVRPSAVYAITGAGAERIAEELRSTPGVRDVQTFGTTREEIDVRTDARLTPDALARSLLPRPIGETLVAHPAAHRIEDVLVDSIRLSAIADIRRRREEPSSIARLNGKPAAIVSVFRDDEAQLLAFDRAVGRVVGERGTAIWSDAAELRTILWRLLIAAAVATIFMPRYVPLAIALIINVWRVADMHVDAQTLLMTAIAIAAVAALSRAVAVPLSFILLLPLAAIFGSGALAPLLGPPARAFALAATCALLAAALGTPASRRLARRRPAAKFILRNSVSVVLAALAIPLFLLSWFGARLDPRRGEGSADRSRVYVRMRLPSGATLAQTTRAAERVEAALRGLEGVKRFWTSATPGNATVVIEVEPKRAELFQIMLRARVPATATIQSSYERSSPASLAESIEEQPYADENGSAYRFLLKGTDADALRRAAEALTTRLARAEVPRQAIHGTWPEPSPFLELVPMKTLPPAYADAAAAELARRTLPPPEAELSGGAILRVSGHDAPVGEDDVPRREEVFARPMQIGDRLLVAESAFDVRAASTAGAVTRELGRFVLPVDVSIRKASRELALAKREEIDRIVSQAPLPAGVIAERPQLGAWNFSAAKLRLAAVAAFLPLLLFTAAAIVLGSLPRAVVALAPATVAIAFVAPVLAAAGARLDETTLLATGAALCGVTALAAVTLLRIGGAAAAYRVLRGEFATVVTATGTGAALLGIAATAHPAIGDAWRAPLLAALAVVVAGVPTALALPAAVDALLRDARRRRGAAARAVARPAAWVGDGVVPHLSVRNLTKVYGTGFRALHRVSFDLSPGVVGLLGPNGAGKTTLLRILTGLLRPTRGAVEYCGVPVRAENLAEFRRSIGFLPQEFNAYAGLTAVQFLDFWALERGIDAPRERRAQIDELLAAVGLEEHANRRVRDFSGGMRQRIGIARALLGNPPLLIVDEPTTGLDIEARRRFRDLLIALARNRIVILSSHIASDVETTALRLLLLARGELRWEGPVDGLLARARGRVFETVVSDAELRALAQQVRITARVRVAEGIRIRGVAADGESLPGAAAEPSLEEAYLAEVSTGAIRRGSFSFVFASR